MGSAAGAATAFTAVRPGHLLALFPMDDALAASASGALQLGSSGLTAPVAAAPERTTIAIEGFGYFFDGGHYFDTPVLPLNPLAAPQLTFGAWVFPYASFSEHDGARAVLTLEIGRASCRERV